MIVCILQSYSKSRTTPLLYCFITVGKAAKSEASPHNIDAETSHFSQGTSTVTNTSFLSVASLWDSSILTSDRPKTEVVA